MDRQIVYAGQIPLESDLLNTNRYAMVGLGKALEAILGKNTVVNGLKCEPTSPASMQVVVGAGEIYVSQNVDSTAYSSLAADTNHQVVKQGFLIDPIILSCPAPTGNNQSIVYLVQANFQEVDSDGLTLPYYNASNPRQGFAGRNNDGSAQPTARRGKCIITLKAGTTATTGSQSTPPVDTGCEGLWTVTVSSNTTTTNITASNISPVPNAPFINEKLVDKAPLASPALTGTPTAPTPATSDNSTTLATTQYVKSNLSSYLPTASAFTQSMADARYATPSSVLAAAPPGTVSHFAMSSVPAGWLKANGAAVSRSVYSNLFSAIGTTYGAGDGSTTFALPDLRGEFIRNWDDGRGVDSGRGLGSWQQDELLNHTHRVGAIDSLSTYGTANVIEFVANYPGPLGQYVTSASTGGTETRPRNIALLACIKY